MTTDTCSTTAAPVSDAMIEAAVRAMICALTGVDHPDARCAHRYDRAVSCIAEEVTELLAALDRQR